MRLLFYTICACLLIGSSAVADADLNELKMNWQKGEIAFEIAAAGPFQFTHQTEQAKDGKPFRVIVDLFPAVHKLGQKSFFDLPQSIVKAVRTSQYSIKPTNTVRIVLDLKAESVYRIEKQGNSVFVYIPDDKTASFAAWSSKSESATASVRVRSEKKGKQPPPVTQSGSEGPSVAIAPEIETPSQTTYHKPQRSSVVEDDLTKPTSASAGPPAKQAVVPTEKPKAGAAPVPKESSQQVKPAADMKAEPTKAAKPEIKKSSPPPTGKTELAASHEEKPVQDKKSKATAPKQTKPAVQTEPTSKKSQASPVVAEKPAAKTDEAKKPTSRFRREPDFPAKLKGTIVAEFPKRLVIKYTPGISRDPFASLFDEAKKTEGPLEKKIPDIETARLVGVLESISGENRVLLEDIDGFGFILKPGDKVKKGYLSQVYSDRAIFQLFEYGWSRSVALNLDDSE